MISTTTPHAPARTQGFPAVRKLAATAHRVLALAVGLLLAVMGLTDRTRPSRRFACR